jgi:hypothetical protein
VTASGTSGDGVDPGPTPRMASTSEIAVGGTKVDVPGGAPVPAVASAEVGSQPVGDELDPVGIAVSAGPDALVEVPVSGGLRRETVAEHGAAVFVTDVDVSGVPVAPSVGVDGDVPDGPPGGVDGEVVLGSVACMGAGIGVDPGAGGASVGGSGRGAGTGGGGDGATGAGSGMEPSGESSSLASASVFPGATT